MIEPRRRPRDRKQAIRDAAAELFAERGFTRVTLEDIGAHVGITGPAIYRHYPGKDALLDAVVIAIAERHVESASAAVDGDDRDRLRVAVERLVGVGLDDPHSVATYLRERHWLSPEGVARHREIERSLSSRWAAILTDHVPGITRGIASVRIAALLGALTVIGKEPKLPRPRLDELLIDSCTAVFVEPAPETTATLPAPGQGWRPSHDRADHILETALPLFRERGFHGTSIDDIAATAGVAVSTIYRRYATKHEILVDAFDRSFVQYQADLDRATAAATSAADALERLTISFAETTLANADLIVVATTEFAALPEIERPRVRRRGRAVFDTWTAVIAEVRPDVGESAARTLAAAMFPLLSTAASSMRPGAMAASDLARLAFAFARGTNALAVPANPPKPRPQTPTMKEPQ